MVARRFSRLNNSKSRFRMTTNFWCRVHAASVNPLDLTIRGSLLLRPLFGLRKPKDTRLGVDYAGTVEAIGKNVTNFKPGDEVFGGKTGALAEYICVLADRAVVLKPANMTFDQAAAVPVAAITALQGLRDKGKIQAGQKVLINGASGGVGTFAVQIAKSFGTDSPAYAARAMSILYDQLAPTMLLITRKKILPRLINVTI